MRDGMSLFFVMTLAAVASNSLFVYNEQSRIFFIFRVAPMYAFTMCKTIICFLFYVFWIFFG